MKIIKADLMDVIEELRHKDNFTIMWTGNSTLTKNNNAVCGRGFAKQITERWPGLKRKVSRRLQKTETLFEKKDKYGNEVDIKWPYIQHIHVDPVRKRYISMFPVKEGYWEKAEIKIIEINAKTIARSAERHPNHRFLINYPGIGAGGLKIENVHEVLKKHWDNLDNIEVYIKPKGVRRNEIRNRHR